MASCKSKEIMDTGHFLWKSMTQVVRNLPC